MDTVSRGILRRSPIPGPELAQMGDLGIGGSLFESLRDRPTVPAKPPKGSSRQFRYSEPFPMPVQPLNLVAERRRLAGVRLLTSHLRERSAQRTDPTKIHEPDR